MSLQETIVAFEVSVPLDTLGVDFKSDYIIGVKDGKKIFQGK